MACSSIDVVVTMSCKKESWCFMPLSGVVGIISCICSCSACVFFSCVRIGVEDVDDRACFFFRCRASDTYLYCSLGQLVHSLSHQGSGDASPITQVQPGSIREKPLMYQFPVMAIALNSFRESCILTSTISRLRSHNAARSLTSSSVHSLRELLGLREFRQRLAHSRIVSACSPRELCLHRGETYGQGFGSQWFLKCQSNCFQSLISI